jgi:hypothetical protein
LRFTDILGNTAESRFMLMNPPMALSIEKVDPTNTPNIAFQTSTTIPVQVRYTPTKIKP